MSYSAPSVTSGVYFTKNLNANTRNAGLNMMGYYFRASKLSKSPNYPITNFDGMVQFLDSNYPTFIESIGDLLDQVPIDKMIASMNEAAAKGYTYYPRPSNFNNAILNNTGYSVVSTLGDAAVAVGEGLVNFSQGILILGVVLGAAFLYFEFNNEFKLTKGIKKAHKEFTS
jgi:hypothetical protein